MYEIIKKSQLVKEIRGSRGPVDLRVVVTRVPRHDEPEVLDRKMKLRLNLEVPRLYYVFADSNLATEEFLAMNSSDGKAKPILSDYVGLFATLNPEDTVGYVKSRLASFREGLTLRKEEDSRRVIQELLTLFPRTEVYLEAARYYRLVKDHDDAIVNYLDYLKNVPNNKDIILELAEVCVAAPLANVTDHRDSVLRHLSTLGPTRMDAPTLSLFGMLASSPEQRQLIVASIEDDPAKLTAQQYRGTLFRSLSELEQWQKVVASATDLDVRDVTVQRILAKAYAKLHLPDKALQILHRLPARDATEALPLLDVLYDLRADVDQVTIRKAIRENRHLEAYVTHYGLAAIERPTSARHDDGEFRSWFRELFGETEKRLTR